MISLCGRFWSFFGWGCKTRLLSLPRVPRIPPKQSCMRSGVGNMCFCCHGSTWEMFCWLCFARLLCLRLDCSWAIVHPSRKQSQPPPCFAALLVNRILGANAAPAVAHLKPLPHFTDFLWELRRQARLPSVRKTPLGHFWRHFFGTAKPQKFWAKFCKMLLLYTIRQNLVSFAFFGVVATRRFLSRNIHCFASKMKNWQKTLREYFGFSAAILRKILKGQTPIPMVGIAFFSVLGAHPRSSRPFLP